MDKQADAAGMVNLMAHPMAGLASASALGMGLAAHMAGIWLGTVMGSAAVARRLMDIAPEAAPRPETGHGDVVRKARAATDAVIADARAKVIQLSTAAERLDARRGRAAARKAAESQPASVKSAPAAKSASKAETRKKPLEVHVGQASAADDLKMISGIGPKLEQALNGLGISTFAGLAGLSEDDAVRIDDKLGLNGRIARDEWIAQARLLTAGGAA
ncbi:MAG TPA: NADH-ubiquinone dehydrogenase [Rhizobiaceae bacterium]|nr:NADH-ubiquinone dehydrogenase [Rhizobiaceae bacterium]